MDLKTFDELLFRLSHFLLLCKICVDRSVVGNQFEIYKNKYNILFVPLLLMKLQCVRLIFFSVHTSIQTTTTTTKILHRLTSSHLQDRVQLEPMSSKGLISIYYQHKYEKSSRL